ncbi:uncharacterized protein LOC121734210 [Aricia agestis]|uniref:uncharacterized protein LOC121734210 n=1 Tax=Aricia agestis TaxID=91739 RepID=UPI001C2060DB|nr:uncharacterized protein LOC121734210 [Aricia agestis]
MNELLQKHGCSNVFSIPDGLKELMSDISREVIREQPADILQFITNYLSALITTREHGVMAVRILDDLCDCRPSLSEHLMQMGLPEDEAKDIANIISEEIEGFEPADEKDKIKESKILGCILKKMPLDEEMAAKVCEIARNAYRDYWYKKNVEAEKINPKSEPWEIAARHTLAKYKNSRPTMQEMNQAAEKIQAAYKGYHDRKSLPHYSKQHDILIPKNYSLPSTLTTGSRTIDFGHIINIKVQEDNIEALFDEQYNKSENTCLCIPNDKKIYNTPADVMSRHSETQGPHGFETQLDAENDTTPAKAPDTNKDWKDNFYLEATKQANKNREELKMSVPPGVLTGVTIGQDIEECETCGCNVPSENALDG